MANPEHLERLQKEVEEWNQWREVNSAVQLDLSGVFLGRIDLSAADLSGIYLGGVDLSTADLSEACLRRAYLCGVDLSKVNLEGANLSEADLRRANLSGANLSGANLSEANLSGANLSEANLSEANLGAADLSGAYLHGADLRGGDLGAADLSGADLSKVNLSEANLSKVDLCGIDLSEANLSGANLNKVDLCGIDLSGIDLSEANLSGANLSGVNLSRVQVLRSNFEGAVFTGACLEDWNINSATNFEGAVCDYIYLKFDLNNGLQERRPREGTFQPGEFSALFQQALDTVDLIFKDGIDWQAFFQSFQELRSQYADQDLSIQAIEKKRGGAFVVRLEVSEDIDKAAVEEKAKALYGEQLKQIEGRYQQLLQLQGQQLDDYREQVQERKQENSRLLGIVETMAEKESISKYDLRGAQFGGGYVAGNVEGNQYGGIINNYGSNAEDVVRLLTALRDQAQTFPTDQKDDANDVLDLLERDLAEEQPDQGRIGRRLKKLVALGAAIGTIASGAAAVSGDVSTFTGNVLELTEQLGIPIEQVQPEQLPPSNQP